MALIGTLRNKMTKWVVGFVAVAIISFILNDLFGNGPRSIFGGNSENVGKIAGTTISLKEYQAAVQERENNYIMNFGRQPGDRERPTLQQQAWELLIVKHAIRAEFEKVGVAVTTDEIEDMVWGKNVDEGIKQSFVDSTGNFDRKKVIEYVNSFNIPEPANPQMAAAWRESRYRWTSFQKELGLGRERIKYENMLLKTNYVTTAEAERDYHNQNDVVEAKYLYVPFFAVSDSAVNVTDEDIRSYYNKNQQKYKTKESRNLSYVSFTVVASAEDTASIKKDMEKIAADFKNVTEDSVFAVSNSEGTNPYSKYSIATLPSFLSNQKESLVAGNVIGPFIDGGSYKVVKIVKIGADTTYTAKASHILIKWDNESAEAKKAAKEKARKILADIKVGADFATKARENGQDGTAGRGGDLGWFTSGQMVKPFESAVFGAKKTGLLGDLVETQYGYHIVSVTNVKDNTSYTVATVEINIEPSEETTNAAYLKAQNFASNLSGVDAFKEKAEKEKLAVLEANELGTAERRVGNLGDARQMVTWLFRDGKVGKVSDVFDLDDQYVVAVMTGETEEGPKPLESIKDEIKAAARRELKAKVIIDKLNAQKGSLEEMAAAFGADATVNTTSDLKLSSNSMQSVGFDPVAVGRAFSLENNKRSAPFKGENGVIVMEVTNKTIAPEVGDYAVFKNQLLQTINNRNGFFIADAIKESSNIQDKRYKFF